MKISPLVPPVVALVLAAGWLGARRQALAGLELEGVGLREKLGAVSGGLTTRDTSAAPIGEPLDWRELAAQARKANLTGVGGQKLVERFQSLSNDEIVQALEHAATMDPLAAGVLRSLLIEAWLEKDPEAALSQLVPTIEADDRGTPHQLAGGLEKWTAKDAVAAQRWFDREVAKGTFASKRLDGGNELLNLLQSGLVVTLISADPAAAERRLVELPENHRAGVLNKYAQSPIDPADQAAFARMVRKSAPAPNQAWLLAHQAGQIASRGGLADVTAYLDRVDASPEEQAQCVKDAARRWLAVQSRNSNITATEVDAMRGWVAGESPQVIDVATGAALANFYPGNFEEMAALALQYNEGSSGDQVLASFLDSLDPQQREKTRSWAESLGDGRLRELILGKLK